MWADKENLSDDRRWDDGVSRVFGIGDMLPLSLDTLGSLGGSSSASSWRQTTLGELLYISGYCVDIV